MIIRLSRSRGCAGRSSERDDLYNIATAADNTAVIYGSDLRGSFDEMQPISIFLYEFTSCRHK